MSTEIESRYWLAHLAWVVGWPTYVIALVIFAFVSEILGGVMATVLGLVLFIAGVVSFIGYYKEAKALRKVKSDWVPAWGLWMIGHLVLTPAIAAPLYILQRWRYIGLPWEQIQESV